MIKNIACLTALEITHQLRLDTLAELKKNNELMTKFCETSQPIVIDSVVGDITF
jgi:hypothetical protein